MKKKRLIWMICLGAACLLGFLLAMQNRPSNTIVDQSCIVYEGFLGNAPVSMMICRNNTKLTAYYVVNGDTKEYCFTGTYHPIRQSFQLENDDGTVVFCGDTYEDKENNGLIVLKGYQRSGPLQNAVYLVPERVFSGYDRDNLYAMGYDTKEVEEFTDDMMELVCANDKKALSHLMSYPLSVQTNHETRKIHDELEFQQHFDEIMPQDYRDAVIKDCRRYLFANYLGIQFGHEKSFWFQKMSDGETFKVTCISNLDEDYQHDYSIGGNSKITKG